MALPLNFPHDTVPLLSSDYSKFSITNLVVPSVSAFKINERSRGCAAPDIYPASIRPFSNTLLFLLTGRSLEVLLADII